MADFGAVKLSLIDLISEQHSTLRRLAETRWKDISDTEFSHTDWFLLGKTEQESLSISRAAAILGISRQAMQKCAKKLEDRGYIKLVFQKGNKRDKYTVLTDKGKKCCQKNNLLKQSIEKEIMNNLGQGSVDALKDLLNRDWV